MPSPIVGLHHVTAIASDPQRNLDFYTDVLGLRFLKRTVNFDDPGTYHFYFGDDAGDSWFFRCYLAGTARRCNASILNMMGFNQVGEEGTACASPPTVTRLAIT
jgi:catechol 2,3-dioxygenase-like lactoylglutathione lyase family enzyme